MGGFYQRKTPEQLALHPNFKLPNAPKVTLSETTMDAVVDYVLEAAASFISPRQEPGEDDEFECIDLARFIREQMPQLIKDKWRKR